MRESSEVLLKRFVVSRSQEAFGALVSRHSGMVYATALRRVNGATGMAEDVTQQVFNLLAKKSKSLTGNGCPAGWLYRQACYLAANEMRTETRRKKREEIAMEMMEPNEEGLPKEVVRELDEALLGLPEKTRNVLVLRFFEGLNYREIGTKFGLSEDGSRKQVDRALERLRERLQRRGVTTSCSSLMVGLPVLETREISGAMKAELVSSGMAQTVGGISLGIHLAAFVAGAMVVSAVAVGVQSARAAGFENDQVHEDRSRSDRRVTRERTAALGSLPLDDLMSRIESLSELPQNAATDLQLSALLARIPNEEIVKFVGDTRSVFSESAGKIAYNALFKRWAEEDPGEALIAALRVRLGLLVGNGTFFYRAEMSAWVRQDPEAAGKWLSEHWQEIEGLGLTWYGGTLVDKFAQSVADSYEARFGIEEALSQLKNFPEETQLELLRNFTGGTLRRMHRKSAHGLYKYLRSFEDSEQHEKMLRRVFKTWGEDDPSGMLEQLAHESIEEQFRAQLYLLCDFHPPGKKSEGADGIISITMDGKPYATHVEREERAYQLGLKAGYDRTQILDSMARELVVQQRGRSTESDWFHQNRGSSNLDELRERLGEIYGQFYVNDGLRFNGHRAYHAALMNTLMLANEEMQVTLSAEIFAHYHRIDPEGARELAQASFLPEGIKERFQTLSKN